MEDLAKIVELVEASKRPVVFTGAGVSKNAGLSTFKDTEANWPYEYPRAEVFSLPFFRDEPLRFWEIYRDSYPLSRGASPTLFHRFCEELDRAKNLTLITQNTDGLHRAKNLIELHGRADRLVCVEDCRWSEGAPPKFSLKDFKNTVPTCPNCHHILKPDISLFLEGINGFGMARDAVVDADLLIVAGTGLEVGPAHEIPQFFNWGKTEDFSPSIWVNPEPFPKSHWFEYEILMGADEFVSNAGVLSSLNNGN